MAALELTTYSAGMQDLPGITPPIRKIHGLGVIVVNATTGNIRAVTELTPKSATGRKDQEVSLPLETRKIGESIWGNFTGALAEAYGDTYTNGADARKALRQSVMYVGGHPFYPGFQAEMAGGLVVCRLAVLVDRGDGSTDNIPPHASNEVQDPRWVSPADFSKPGTRELAQIAVEHVLETGIYADTLRVFRHQPGMLRPVFPKRFSIRDMYDQRERLADMNT